MVTIQVNKSHEGMMSFSATDHKGEKSKEHTYIEIWLLGLSHRVQLPCSGCILKKVLDEFVPLSNSVQDENMLEDKAITKGSFSLLSLLSAIREHSGSHEGSSCANDNPQNSRSSPGRMYLGTAATFTPRVRSESQYAIGHLPNFRRDLDDYWWESESPVLILDGLFLETRSFSTSDEQSTMHNLIEEIRILLTQMRQGLHLLLYGFSITFWIKRPPMGLRRYFPRGDPSIGFGRGRMGVVYRQLKIVSVRVREDMFSEPALPANLLEQQLASEVPLGDVQVWMTRNLDHSYVLIANIVCPESAALLSNMIYTLVKENPAYWGATTQCLNGYMIRYFDSKDVEITVQESWDSFRARINRVHVIENAIVVADHYVMG